MSGAKKAVVLLSGGLDSTLVLYEAIAKHGADGVLALSVRYGQRHAFEVMCAAAIAGHAGVDHEEEYAQFGARGALVDGSASALDSVSAVVDGRNAHLTTIAGAWAKRVGASEVWLGCCAADAAVFRDCRPEWLLAQSLALSLGIADGLRLVAPCIDRTKAQIVGRAWDLGCWHAIKMSWSCYAPPGAWEKGRPPTCGACGACVARRDGFREARLSDPAVAS